MNRLLKWMTKCWIRYFPNHYQRWLEKEIRIVSQIKPDYITLQQVMIVNNIPKWTAEVIMKTAVRRKEFTEHVNPQNGEKYWKLADWYKEAVREGLVSNESSNK